MLVLERQTAKLSVATLLLLGLGACSPSEPAAWELDPVVTADGGQSQAPGSVGTATGSAGSMSSEAPASGSEGGLPGPAGASDGKPATDGGANGPIGPDAGAGCATFDSSFAAIQKVIFEGRGCTAQACHGEAKVGGLDLRADVAWENLVDAKSSNSALVRVQPGTANDSFLYKKLLAATKPGSVEVTGSPMPVGTAALSEKELEAVQLWILKGAPKVGTVSDPLKSLDVGSLLDACLPPAKPVKTKPLDPPPAAEGIQFRLPSYLLKASSEVELCIPFAYDFTDVVPAKFKDETRNVIYVNGTQVRQDPQSHHLVLWNPRKDLSSVPADEPGWLCHGGDRDGQTCKAANGSRDCGTGLCAGKSNPGSLCGVDITGVTGPGGDLESFFGAVFAGLGIVANGGMPDQIANTQSPQEYLPPIEGVYSEIPLRGILWFNSHAFNLTDEDTELDARVNYLFAQKLEREMRPMSVIDNLNIATGLPPFTRKTFCGKHVVPEGYSMPMLTGHTHRRGEHFWITDSTGKKIYENFNYNDPEFLHFKPWLTFGADEASRTLEYCATFNNGLKKDGSPDLGLVTRASRMPSSTKCTPVACVAGKVTAACTSDRDCDSAPGKNDGDCDACPITQGVTTENEMFVMMPWYILPPKN